MADGPKAVQVAASWVGAEDLPVQFANAFAAVVGPNAVFLTIGSVVPPEIPGVTEEDREAQMSALTTLALTATRSPVSYTLTAETR